MKKFLLALLIIALPLGIRADESEVSDSGITQVTKEPTVIDRLKEADVRDLLNAGAEPVELQVEKQLEKTQPPKPSLMTRWKNKVGDKKAAICASLELGSKKDAAESAAKTVGTIAGLVITISGLGLANDGTMRGIKSESGKELRFSILSYTKFFGGLTITALGGYTTYLGLFLQRVR